MKFILATTLLSALSMSTVAGSSSKSTRHPSRSFLSTAPIQKLSLTYVSPESVTKTDAHPQMTLQSYMNRGALRHSQMLGGEVASSEELATAMRSRWEAILSGNTLAKRQTDGTADGGDNSTTTTTTPVAAVGSAPVVDTSLPLSIIGRDVGYFAEIQIGTPPAPFKILMDSGSADFWVSASGCSDCGDHARLGSDTSSSFVDSGKAFQVSYGTGNAQGTIVTDNLIIGSLSLSNTQFGATNAESQDFGANSVVFDGLMGLASSQLSNQGVSTPPESLRDAGQIAQAIVGYHLSRSSDGTNDGEITFGGIDPSKFTGDLTTFANVNTRGFWEGAVGDVSVNGQSLNIQGQTAILDTGTTLALVPTDVATSIHNAIPRSAPDGQGGFTIPCDTTASVAFSFGGASFAINPKDLIFQNLGGNTCVSGISSTTSNLGANFLLGDVFLKSVYFTTNIDTNQIGLARSISA